MEGPALRLRTDESMLIVSEAAPSPISSAMIEMKTLESLTGHFSRGKLSWRLSSFLLRSWATSM